LIRACKEAGESVRAIGPKLARHATIGANAIFAREARHAIVGVAAARLDTQATMDLEVARVGGIAAVEIVLAGSSTGDEAPGVILAAGGQTNLADGTRSLVIAKRLEIGTRRTQDARRAPGASIWNASVRDRAIRPCVDGTIEVDASIRIDGGIASRIGGCRWSGGAAAAGRGCHSQRNTSKEAHDWGKSGDRKAAIA
jgi:hypothetical protein